MFNVLIVVKRKRERVVITTTTLSNIFTTMKQGISTLSFHGLVTVLGDIRVGILSITDCIPLNQTPKLWCFSVDSNHNL